jgi:hypothetical protein
MSDELSQQEKDLVSEIANAMKDEGYTEDEIKQGLELAYHIRTKVKSKDDALSDCC